MRRCITFSTAAQTWYAGLLSPCWRCFRKVLPATEVELIECLRTLPLSKVDSLFFRMLSPQWIKSLDSIEGARLYGGRFNPRYDLAATGCKIDGGFGFLYTATNPITCLFECKHILRGLGDKQFQILAVPPSLRRSLVDVEKVLDRLAYS